ncbi:MAG: RNA methyltransferase [bacterium]|nr:RNA methyltransferase [bacterium]
MSAFQKVHFILVETKYEGNLGAAARALDNLGFSRLALVNPRVKIGDEARKWANQSQKILENARIYSSLAEAVDEMGLVVGTTRRKGIQRGHAIVPREMADMAAPLARVNQVGVVFGPEDRGLTTRELKLCRWVVRIPSPSANDSFNLAQAVAIVGYDLMAALREKDIPRLATTRNQEAMFKRLEVLLTEIGFLREDDPTRMMVKIRRMFYRSGLSEQEIKILQGMISQIREKIQMEGKK